MKLCIFIDGVMSKIVKFLLEIKLSFFNKHAIINEGNVVNVSLKRKYIILCEEVRFIQIKKFA